MAAQPDYIDIVLDKGGQRRMALEPIRWHCNGQDWDQEFSEDAYHDAETGLVFLRPAYYYPAWLTSNSGIYAKYRKADYTLTTSASWYEHTASGAGNYFLASSDVNEAVTTSAVLGAVNQAMKAAVVARKFLRDEAIDLVIVPEFVDIDLGGASQADRQIVSGLQLTVRRVALVEP